MKKLIVGMLVALVVAATGLARAQCPSCGKAGEAKAESAAKMCCPCMMTHGLTLTDEQKAKVDALQAKCKDGCSKGCCKACAAAMKEILTPEQQTQWQENMAAAKKGGCCTAPKADEKK